MEKVRFKIDLQLFGGRGSMSSGGGGSLGKGGGEMINIVSATDVWSYRHNKNNEPFVDSINSSVRDISDDFPGVMDTVRAVDAAELGGADRTSTLGFYGGGRLGMNQYYTDAGRMDTAYDQAVKDGFHPSRGNKGAVEAVTYHEMGHALTDYLAQKNGVKDLHEMSAEVVKKAYKKSGLKGGNMGLAKQISGYAQKNYAECVAEAVADYYCNGKKASKASRLIMDELRAYNK